MLDLVDRWHWPPSEFDRMPMRDAVRWRRRMTAAKERMRNG